MSDPDWGDPDREPQEAARERERRRAEREARRSERAARAPRTAVADRVRELLSGTDQTQASATPAPPPRPPGQDAAHRRRRLVALAAVAALIVGVLVVVAAIRHFDDDGGAEVTAQQAKPAKTLTLPEGYDRQQMATIAEEAGLRGDYLKASQSFRGFDPGKYGAKSPESLEGFLFPATYELPRRPTVEDLVPRQLDAFEQNISGVSMGYARSKNLTTYDVLIIASMIEREVQVPRERKLVAAVIYNRLHAGMPLQIDATIRYATGNFTEPISPAELETDSPYNTYASSGLPPGPIGNPGLASIEAAARPAQVAYLYYVVKPNTCGEHTFATTLAAFNRAKAAYDEARQANGGNAPTPSNCP